MTHEEQMIQDVLDGKTDSFRWIIERYQRPIFRMIFNLVHDRHVAEDIAQDVFMAVFEKLSTFDPMRCKFSTWLFTITRNKSINYLRKKKQPISIDPQEIITTKKNGDPLGKEEFFRQMDLALKRLPKGQKRAFVLAEFENLPYDQIAQIECVSIGTVKSRIHRAKKKLQKALGNMTGEQQ